MFVAEKKTFTNTLLNKNSSKFSNAFNLSGDKILHKIVLLQWK